MIYILLLLLYAVSTYCSYRYSVSAHSEEGRWSNMEIDGSVRLCVFCPILNTLYCIIGYLFYPPKRNP